MLLFQGRAAQIAPLHQGVRAWHDDDWWPALMVGLSLDAGIWACLIKMTLFHTPFSATSTKTVPWGFMPGTLAMCSVWNSRNLLLITQTAPVATWLYSLSALTVILGFGGKPITVRHIRLLNFSAYNWREAIFLEREGKWAEEGGREREHISSLSCPLMNMSDCQAHSCWICCS